MRERDQPIDLDPRHAEPFGDLLLLVATDVGEPRGPRREAQLRLAPALGRQAAHDLVYEACRIATDERRALLDVLLDMPEVTAKLDQEELAQLCEPGNYVGEAPEMVDRLLAGLAPRG